MMDASCCRVCTREIPFLKNEKRIFSVLLTCLVRCWKGNFHELISWAMKRSTDCAELESPVVSTSGTKSEALLCEFRGSCNSVVLHFACAYPLCDEIRTHCVDSREQGVAD